MSSCGRDSFAPDTAPSLIANCSLIVNRLPDYSLITEANRQPWNESINTVLRLYLTESRSY